MSQIMELLKTTTFNVTEGENVTVGDFWKNQVFFYKYERIYFVTDGYAELILKDKKIELKKNHMYFIPSHSVITGNCPYILSHHFIHFHWDEKMYNLYYFMNIKNEIEGSADLEKLFFRVEELIKKESTPASELEINGIMQILLSKFIPEQEPTKDFIRFLDLASYIDSNIDKLITVEELAEKYYLNPVYFSNQFTKHMGISPSQFIINRKLEKAMEYMKNSNMSIKEISNKVGFKDSLYFSRLFKEKIGITPSQFKKS